MPDWKHITFGAVAVAVAHVGLLGWVTIHAVLNKRESRAVIGWVGLAWLAPFMGAVAYFLFGINRIERKATALEIHDAREKSRLKYPTRLHGHDDFVGEFPFWRGLDHLGAAATGRSLVSGNEITPLINGDQAYPAMLKAISQAQRSISLLSYIFDNDEVGQMFVDELAKAKRRGVEVRVLIDSVGAQYSWPKTIMGALYAAGINSARFLPTALPRLPSYSNLRNHRKILVVDGKHGFTGGTNIRVGHWLNKNPEKPVQCLHFSIKGPVVAHMQEVFAIDWLFTAEELLTGDLWFPNLNDEVGETWCRGITDGPDEDFDKITEYLIGVLGCAQREVKIVTPYFLPSSALIQALNVAALRGVDIRIYLPQENNIRLVHWASRAQLDQNLEKGCRVYYTPPPFDHTKLMVVDQAWSFIGSTNWDDRSLRLNFEFNVECYDRKLAAELDGIIQEKVQHARELTLNELKSRSLPIRLRDGLSRLMTPYL